ncbi:MAG TPA: M66 family metalloprotease [Lysobacter sp.]
MTSKTITAALAASLAVALAVAGCGGGASQPADAPQMSAFERSAPTNLTATGGDASVTLAWTRVDDATSYNVYQGTAAGGEGATPMLTGVTGTTVNVTGLANGTTYYFVVRGVDSKKRISSASNEASARPFWIATTPIQVTAAEVAQTHVLPVGGKDWTLANGKKETLHLAGGRDTFVLMKLSAGDGVNLELRGSLDGVELGAVPLALPAALPPSEENGPAYGADLYSATIPAAWVKPGLALRVTSYNYLASNSITPVIGADVAMKLRVLPVYAFGADEADMPFAQVAEPDAVVVRELAERWPVARLDSANHPAQKLVLDTLPIKPSGTVEGYIAHNTNELKGTYDAMNTVLEITRGMLTANGEIGTPTQYYSPLIGQDANGNYRAPGGGLGGGSVGTGMGYSGIFFHEQGHAFGLPHQGEAYAAGNYPYIGGSMNGSAWQFDLGRREFQPLFVSAAARNFSRCTTQTYNGYPRQFDAQGRCIKQDSMQSGDGDQSPSTLFIGHSDYSTAMIQRWFEGVTTKNATTGVYTNTGKAVYDPTFPNKYRRWNTIERRWDDYNPASTTNGQNGLNNNFPITRDVPVHSIVVTISNTTPALTQVLPTVSFTGNLLDQIDPTDAAQRTAITPGYLGGTGASRWFCYATIANHAGCDYTVRVTYADGSVRHVLLQGGFRPVNRPSDAPTGSPLNPASGYSFRLFAINVPGDKALSKIELLSTPMAWNGMPDEPVVLATR